MPAPRRRRKVIVPDLDDLFARPRKFRAYVIESVWNVHFLGIVLGLAVAITECVKTWPAADDVATKAKGAGYLTMLLVFLFAPRTYERHFEVFCELCNWLAFIARHAALARGDQKWILLRPISLVASVISMRYEFRRQWFFHLVRLGMDAPLNMRRKLSAGRLGISAAGLERGSHLSRDRHAGWMLTAEVIPMVGTVTTSLTLHYWLEQNILQMFLALYDGQQREPEGRQKHALRGSGEGSATSHMYYEGWGLRTPRW